MMPQTPATARHRTNELLRIVLLVFGGQVAVLYFLHFVYISGGSIFGAFFQSLDFVYFHNAARVWLAGRDPYTSFGFVTPPLSLVIPTLLGRLTLARATFIFLCLNVAVVPLAFWWYAGALKLRLQERILLMLCGVLFISAQECVRGGNMDGLMLVLLIAAFSVRRRLGGAVWLAASIGLKLYSVILLPVALRRRQWRFAGCTLLALVVLLLPFFHLWPSAIHALFARDSRFLQMSIAPPMLLYSLLGNFSSTGKRFCLAFWLITFFWALYADNERELTPATVERYVPWMLAWPALVFSYTGVLALTVLASLVATARLRPLRRAEYACFAGFLLLGIHVEHITNLLPLVGEKYVFYRSHAAVIQSLGVVVMILGTCLSPCGKQEGELDEAAREEAAVTGDKVPGRSRQEVRVAEV